MFANDSFAGFCYGIECEHKANKSLSLRLRLFD